MNFGSSRPHSDRLLAKLDYWLLIPVLLITLIGLVVLNNVLKAGYGSGTYPSNFLRQLGAVLVGLFVALLLCLFELPTLKLLAYFVYGAGVILLLWAKIDSVDLSSLTGSDSWINLPFIGSFQPSELAKIGIALMGAMIFEDLREGHVEPVKGFIKLAVAYGFPLLLILKEPDFGTAVVVIFMFLAVLFVWGISWRNIFLMGGGAVLLLPMMWFLYFDNYQRGRVLTFLFPGHNEADSYHITQALHAIGSSGLIGNRGADYPVPVKESDFIYTAVAEQLGFIGTLTLVILFIIFLVRACIVAARAAQSSYFASYLIIGLVSSIAFHAIENMGMNVGLVPITGIPLPFVSNGGTSMLMSFFALGFMLNCSINTKEEASLIRF